METEELETKKEYSVKERIQIILLSEFVIGICTAGYIFFCDLSFDFSRSKHPVNPFTFAIAWILLFVIIYCFTVIYQASIHKGGFFLEH